MTLCSALDWITIPGFNTKTSSNHRVLHREHLPIPLMLIQYYLLSALWIMNPLFLMCVSTKLQITKMRLLVNKEFVVEASGIYSKDIL